MPDFSKTIIYKIVHKTNPDDYDVYVGHSTDIQSRKWDHKKSCNNENSKMYNFKVYQYIRENGGWDNFEIIEIEKYPCNSRNEACQKEQEWCYKLNSKLNTDIPNRTPKEWWEDNKERLKILNKQWRTNNREYINEKMRDYRKNNLEKMREYEKQKATCDNCGSIVRKSDIARHKKTQKCINTKK